MLWGSDWPVLTLVADYGPGFDAEKYFADRVTLSGTVLLSNTAQSEFGRGGGMYANAAALLTATLFEGNAASSGGGVYAYGAVTATGGLLQANRAITEGGGGLYSNASVSLSGVQFLSNTKGVCHVCYRHWH